MQDALSQHYVVYSVNSELQRYTAELQGSDILLLKNYYFIYYSVMT